MLQHKKFKNLIHEFHNQNSIRSIQLTEKSKQLQRRSQILNFSNFQRDVNLVKRKKFNEIKKHNEIKFITQKKIEKHNYLWIVFWVKKFIEILKSAIIINKLQKLKTYHLELIGDPTYFKYFLVNVKKRINNPLHFKKV